jgi:hypothetical protein
VDLTPDITLLQTEEDLTAEAATAALPPAVDNESPQVLPVTGDRAFAFGGKESTDCTDYTDG